MEIPFRSLPKIEGYEEEPRVTRWWVATSDRKPRTVARKGNIHVPEEAASKVLHGMCVMKGKLPSKLLQTVHADMEFIPRAPVSAPTDIPQEQCEEITKYLTSVFMSKLKEYAAAPTQHAGRTPALPTIKAPTKPRKARPYTAPSKASPTRHNNGYRPDNPPTVEWLRTEIARLEEKKTTLTAAIEMQEQKQAPSSEDSPKVLKPPPLILKGESRSNLSESWTPASIPIPASPVLPSPVAPVTSPTPTPRGLTSVAAVSRVVSRFSSSKLKKKSSTLPRKRPVPQNKEVGPVSPVPEMDITGSLGLTPAGRFLDKLKLKHTEDSAKSVVPKSQVAHLTRVGEFHKNVDSVLDELKRLEARLEKQMQLRSRLTLQNIAERYDEVQAQVRPPPPKQDDILVLYHRNEWREAHVLHAAAGSPVVKIASNEESFAQPVTLTKSDKFLVCTPAEVTLVEDLNRRNESDAAAREKLSNTYTEIEHTKGFEQLLEKARTCHARNEVVEEQLVSKHQERRHLLNLQLQAVNTQINQSKKQQDELKSDEFRVELLLTEARSGIKAQGEIIKNLRSRTNRVKYKGKYKTMLRELLSDITDDAEELLGLTEVEVQNDLSEAMGAGKLFWKNKEKVIVQEIDNLKACVQELANYNCELESEITCSKCLVSSTEVVMMWPCGHSFCSRCAAAMEVGSTSIIQTWRCMECDQVSAFEPVPNQAITALSTKWSVKESGHRDLTVAIMAFEAELADLARKHIVPLATHG